MLCTMQQVKKQDTFVVKDHKNSNHGKIFFSLLDLSESRRLKSFLQYQSPKTYVRFFTAILLNIKRQS